MLQVRAFTALPSGGWKWSECTFGPTELVWPKSMEVKILDSHFTVLVGGGGRLNTG